MKYLIKITVICTILSCINKLDSLDPVRWDFYKKNLKSNFFVEGNIIPFYQTELSIEEIEGEDGVGERCFYGVFSFNEFSTGNGVNTGKRVPITTVICYNNELTEIMGYFTGCAAVVTYTPAELLEEEEKKLRNYSMKEEASGFLKSYVHRVDH